jgi:ParB family chromosome partitioning protein
MKRLPEYDVYEVPLEDIWVDKDFNCRDAFAPESIKSLADSIRAQGLKFPVVLQQQEDSQMSFPCRYRLIAGFRRYEATALFLREENIRANIRIGLNDRDAEILNLTENLERKDLNPLEEARAIARLFPDGASLRTISAEMKRDTRWVHQRLRILRLPEELQKKVAAKLLTLLDVELLVALPLEEQVPAAKEIIAERAKGGKKANWKPHLKRSFRYRRTKQEVNDKIALLLKNGLGGLATRFGAWFAGYISDDDFDQDINRAIREKSSIFR